MTRRPVMTAMPDLPADGRAAEKIHIVYACTAEEARAAVVRGHEPVECSFGAHSVVGPLEMDHHGAYAHLPGVAVRAHGEAFGARASDPRFVVAGNPDADAVGAIVGLAGLHRLGAKESTLINANDIDPVATGDLLAHGVPGLRLLWFQSKCRRAAASLYSAEGFRRALDLFLEAYTQELTPEVVGMLRESEETRVRQGMRGFRAAGRVGFARSPDWAFDVWYRECPVVVAWVHRTGRVSIGARDEATAAEVCGTPAGLLDVVGSPDFIRRFGEGWGGRPAIVGNPRGRTMTPEEAEEVWKWLQERVDGP